MEELTKEEQLRVLEVALNAVKYKYDDDNYHYCCIAILNALQTEYEIVISDDDIHELIPSFTKDNAIAICKRHKITQPKDYSYGSTWWDMSESKNPKITDRSVRIKFMNAFISDFKKNI